jgi:integrase
MVDGQRIHRAIGRESDGTTRTQAEEFIEKARQDAKAGRLNLPKGRKLALSFREVAEKYLAKLGQEGGKDIPMKRYRLEQHLVPFFGDTPLSKIATFDVERYKKQRSAEPVKRPNGPGGKPTYVGTTKPATINRELAALSHLLNKAVEWGWLDHRPATIKRLKEHSGRITYLTVDQIERLLKAAEGDQNRQIYPFIRIGLETSMRKSEILGIRREHIDTRAPGHLHPEGQGRRSRAAHHQAAWPTTSNATLPRFRRVRSGCSRQPPPWRGARSIWTNRFAAA